MKHGSKRFLTVGTVLAVIIYNIKMTARTVPTVMELNTVFVMDDRRILTG